MVADACGDAGRNFGRADFSDAVAERSGFTAGDGDADEWQENSIGAKNLAEFTFTNVTWVDTAVVDDWAEARAAEAEFCMRVFTVDELNVIRGGESVFMPVA